MSISLVVKNENMFPTTGLCAKQILGIVGSQIDIERIFSLAGIFRRCGL